MLKVTADPNVDEVFHSLPDVENHTIRRSQSLDNGFITFSLRELFKSAGTGPSIWLPMRPSPASPREQVQLGRHQPRDKAVNRRADRRRQDVSAPGARRSGRSGRDHSGVPAAPGLQRPHRAHHRPERGEFPFTQDAPDFYTNPASPDRRQPYREFTIIYHQAGNTVQAFPQWSNNNLFGMINAGMDRIRDQLRDRGDRPGDRRQPARRGPDGKRPAATREERPKTAPTGQSEQ